MNQKLPIFLIFLTFIVHDAFCMATTPTHPRFPSDRVMNLQDLEKGIDQNDISQRSGLGNNKLLLGLLGLNQASLNQLNSATSSSDGQGGSNPSSNSLHDNTDNGDGFSSTSNSEDGSQSGAAASARFGVQPVTQAKLKFLKNKGRVLSPIIDLPFGTLTPIVNAKSKLKNTAKNHLLNKRIGSFFPSQSNTLESLLSPLQLLLSGLNVNGGPGNSGNAQSQSQSSAASDGGQNTQQDPLLTFLANQLDQLNQQFEALTDQVQSLLTPNLEALANAVDGSSGSSASTSASGSSSGSASGSSSSSGSTSASGSSSGSGSGSSSSSGSRSSATGSGSGSTSGSGSSSSGDSGSGAGSGSGSDSTSGSDSSSGADSGSGAGSGSDGSSETGSGSSDEGTGAGEGDKSSESGDPSAPSSREANARMLLTNLLTKRQDVGGGDDGAQSTLPFPPPNPDQMCQVMNTGSETGPCYRTERYRIRICEEQKCPFERQILSEMEMKCNEVSLGQFCDKNCFTTFRNECVECNFNFKRVYPLDKHPYCVKYKRCLFDKLICNDYN